MRKIRDRSEFPKIFDLEPLRRGLKCIRCGGYVSKNTLTCKECGQEYKETNIWYFP